MSELVRGAFCAVAALVVTSCTPEPQPWPVEAEPQPVESSSQVHARMAATMDSLYATRWNISTELSSMIHVAADAHDIPLDLAHALVWVESRFYPRALSHAGARGLTQVMPATGAEHCGLAEADLWRRRANLDCGFSFLRMLHDRFQAWPAALAAYNTGPARYMRSHLTGEYSGLPYAAAVLAAR